MAKPPNTPAATPTLVCKECGFENEPERVYCHQCGAKLDRSLLPPEALSPKEDPEEVRRRLRRMANPPGAGVKLTMRRLLSSLLLGAVFAAVVLACLPPRDSAPPPAEQVENARLLSAELEDASAAPGPPRRLVFPEAVVNAYLAANVSPRRVNAGAPAYLPSFERVYVRFLDGNVCRVTQQLSMFGLPLYTTCDYRPLARPDGRLTAEPGAGALGRMPLPAAAMRPLAPFVYQTLFEKQKGDMNLLGRLGGATCRKEQVELVTRPNGGG